MLYVHFLLTTQEFLQGEELGTAGAIRLKPECHLHETITKI